MLPKLKLELKIEEIGVDVHISLLFFQ